MALETILTILFVLGVVWGGLAHFLIKAVKHERLKTSNGEK